MTNIKFLLFLLITINFGFAQTARLKGIVLDENNKPVEKVNVTDGKNKTLTNENGFYSLTIDANKKVSVVFTHVSLKQITTVLELKPNEDLELNPIMNDRTEEMGELILTNRRKSFQGITTIDPIIIRKIPGANSGIENILKTLPGVSNNNELSSGFNVRGGNFDENLVYVNDVEVYRPFLVRSGQQEGLSFTNTDLVQNVDFSGGGFQAKYGDKLSSVLDINYRTPNQFGASAELSFLGANASVDLVSKNLKWNAITGVRYRNNQLLVDSQETESNFRPTFADVQTCVNYNYSTKLQYSFLGNISRNTYNYQPLSRSTNFGTIDDPKVLLIDYSGQEKDKYQTFFGAFKASYKPNEKNNYKFITSMFNTQEQEYFDIAAAYSLGERDTNLGSESFGNVKFARAAGSQLTHARNDLGAIIFNIEAKGFHERQKNQFEWGIKSTHEDIKDRVREYEIVDSAGFSLNPPIKTLPTNDQPYNSFVGPLTTYQSISAKNLTKINRVSGYFQWSRRDNLGSAKVWYNAGLRFQDWRVSGNNINGDNQIVFSPRAQFSIKPDWESDMIFRISGGLYAQPPFYRELRDLNGTVQPNVKDQKSIHIVLSNDYTFKLWKRPFKLVSEAYYKTISDLNAYTLENVRIRYAANNNAVGYAQGLDFRLNGEFVPGTDSWLSLGYLKTEENIDDKGFIARPTDQRLKFGVLFQDFMPKIPSVKVYLNLVYNTGLPGGSPSYADVYKFQNRLRDYRRADAGFSYVFTEKNGKRNPNHWLQKFKDLSVGFEIFNMFNNQNAISNIWVRDSDSKSQSAIPNYLTTRVFSLKLSARL